MLAVGDKENLERLYKELLNKDWFMTFPDFKAYCEAKEKAFADYEDRTSWARKMLVNISQAGYFSSDRTIGEYDRRVVILTREKGKISAFARGARKPTSAFLAPTSPFTFGTFELYAGRNSYSVCDISADCYFEELRQDFEGAYYGMYSWSWRIIARGKITTSARC